MNEPDLHPKQMSFRDAVRAIAQSPFRLSVAASLCALVGLLLPFIGTRIDFGIAQSRLSLNGFDAAGWVAVLALVLFVTASAAHKVVALAPYRSLIELAAVAGTGVTILDAWFYNPAATMIDPAFQLQRQFAPGGTGVNEMIRQYPHIGMLVVVAAAMLVMLARRRDRLTPGT